MTYTSPNADLQAFKVSCRSFSACALLPTTLHSPARWFADERESLLLGPVQTRVAPGREEGVKEYRGRVGDKVAGIGRSLHVYSDGHEITLKGLWLLSLRSTAVRRTLLLFARLVALQVSINPSRSSRRHTCHLYAQFQGVLKGLPCLLEMILPLRSF
jgi:hypothetical protein